MAFAPRTPTGSTVALLLAGVAGGIGVTVISLLLGAVEPGFDFRRHANSQLVLGDHGWIQTVDFIVFGLLLMTCAVGIARVVRPYRSGQVAAIGVFLYGLCAGVVVGFNPTDPAYGFPPGTPDEYRGLDKISTSAHIHGIAGMIGFLAMTVACFALARYFAVTGAPRWAAGSAVMGLSVVAVCGYLAANASAAGTRFNFLPTWVVGTALWLFVPAVCARLIALARAARPETVDAGAR